MSCNEGGGWASGDLMIFSRDQNPEVEARPWLQTKPDPLTVGSLELCGSNTGVPAFPNAFANRRAHEKQGSGG